MRIVALLIIIAMICGCAVIVSEDDKVRTYGVREEEGLDTLERIEDVPEDEKREWFERKEKE